MEKKITLLFFISAAITVCSTTSQGLTPMGPPRSTLQESTSSIGIEFSRSEIDLQTFGQLQQLFEGAPSPEYFHCEYKIEGLESNMIMGRLDVGIWEDWDIFLRLGATDAQMEITEILANEKTGDQFNDFDGSYGFSWGLGTKMTLYQEGDTTWGGLFQVTWANPGGSDVTLENDPITPENDTNFFSGDADIDYWVVKIAIGPTVEFDNLRLYGGPFLHFVNGELELNGTYEDPSDPTVNMIVESSHDIKEESQIGGYFGAQWYLGYNSTLYTELQLTDDGWGMGAGTVWRF